MVSLLTKIKYRVGDHSPNLIRIVSIANFSLAILSIFIFKWKGTKNTKNRLKLNKF